jgi:hypothetical protein
MSLKKLNNYLKILRIYTIILLDSAAIINIKEITIKTIRGVFYVLQQWKL